MARIRQTAAPVPSKSMDAESRKYEVRDALRTIQRAEEIKSDRALMRDVKREAKTQVKALAKVTGGGRANKPR